MKYPSVNRQKTVGVLALQGGYDAHIRHLNTLGLSFRKLRDVSDFNGLDGLIIPGGESSVMLNLIERRGLRDALLKVIDQGLPTLVTCAGMILLAEQAYLDISRQITQASYQRIGISIVRNGWGRQIESGFKKVDIIPGHLDADHCQMMFVRAPRIVSVRENVTTIGTVNGEPVWVNQGSIHALSGHPELTSSNAVHRDVFSSLL